ncbi:MAG: hypothetical protein UW41_C0019G0005 [Candidatus Collierbacteria bacterium GW2011_GWC2_44_18]|uniref:Serine-tRNA synthetase type1 N-terminal domain-containing protein n=1 Tax=Candidatus Collierbacteria bacterium GW2011_GWC2_44_18 TaxID=1618392 RepID=A0A0G1HPB4_9BACT|nr:MAG: hypothetical protein UW41_C0019G0005 [Candidatus Collierbacteria bacterium GW2011_GWC2_44_18]
MLDINYIRDNQESLKKAITNKQFDPTLVDKLIAKKSKNSVAKATLILPI